MNLSALASIVPSHPPTARHRRPTVLRPLSLPLLALLVNPVAAGILYDEGNSGDLSGDRLNPTALGSLSAGSNTLRATSTAGDLEYVTFTVPAGYTLQALDLTEFVSTDDTAFLAIQSGTTFTVAPANAGANLGSLLGYTHFGTGGAAGSAIVGTDVLDELGAGTGSIGFTPPLGAGDYTFWIQQTQAAPSTYTFDLVAVPEPGSITCAVGVALLGGLLVRRIRRAQPAS